jgi:hypothetical protein
MYLFLDYWSIPSTRPNRLRIGTLAPMYSMAESAPGARVVTPHFYLPDTILKSTPVEPVTVHTCDPTQRITPSQNTSPIAMQSAHLMVTSGHCRTQAVHAHC